MFQLFDLLITSPIGVFAFGIFQDLIYAAVMAADCDECGFNDLGKLLLGGVAAAVIAGIGISLVIRRSKRDRKDTSDFVSIRTTSQKE